MTEEKILDRVQKMLALANDTRASEGERDNALRMAYNLLAKHNLTIEDVEARSRDNSDPRVNHPLDSWSQLWAKHIFNAMGKLFFCKYYFGKKINATKCRHHFTGRTSNATTAAVMGEYLVTSILRECRKLYTHNLAPESRAFATAAAYRICARVDELIKLKQEETAQEASDGRALVLADLYRTEADANALFLQETGIALKSGKARKARDMDPEAYRKGHAYGDKVGLNVQVGGKAKVAGHLS